MITKEAAKAFLETKKLENPTAEKLAKVKQLKGDAQLLGRLILNDVAEYKDEQKHRNWYNLGEKRLEAIEGLLKEASKGKNIWTGEFEKTLVALFGSWSTYVIKAWALQGAGMYQSGYYRRSFRSPNNAEITFSRRVNWLIQLANTLYYNLDLSDYVRYYAYLRNSPSLCHIWAAATMEDTEEGQQILAVLLDTVYGRDDVAAVNREAIKALLLTENKTAWEGVEKLLLSAQRQEGLRQTIFESLDETSLPAFVHFLKIILDNNLLRFSSIKRSIDVWTGLAWETARDKTIQRMMEMAYDFLVTPSEIEKALAGKDNLAAYMALWAKGCIDIETTFPAIQQLLESGDDLKKSLALWFLNGTNLPKTMHRLAYPYINSDSLMVAGLAIQNSSLAELKKDTTAFDKLLKLWERIPVKGADFSGKLFEWTIYKFEPSEVMSFLVDLVGETTPEQLSPYYKRMDLSSRESLARYLVKRKTFEPVHRTMIFDLLRDKSQWVRSMGLTAIKKWTLEVAENQYIESLLTRTSGDFRVGAIELLFKQEDTELTSSIDRLLAAKNINQRLAGLDLLRQLVKKDRLKKEALTLAATYQERSKVSQKEALILSDILASDGVNYSEENGFGLYDLTKLTRSPNPKPQPQLSFVLDEERIFTAIKKLDDLIAENKDYEYEAIGYDQQKEMYLLGNTLTAKIYIYGEKDLSPRQRFEALPLYEIWETWYQENGLSPWDLRLLSLADGYSGSYYKIKDWAEKIIKQFYPSTEFLKKAITENYDYQHSTILRHLREIYPVAPRLQTELDICEAIFAAIPEDKWNEKVVEEKHWYNNQSSWRELDAFNFLKTFIRGFDRLEISDEFVPRTWHLANWRYQTNQKPRDEDRPSLEVTAKAYQKGLINEDDLFSKIFNSENSLRQLTGKKQQEHFDAFPFLEAILNKSRERILEIELKRGDSQTLVSNYAKALQRIEGIPYLMEILQALGKDTISQSAFYGSGGNKKEVISLLLRRSFPKKEETLADFKAALAKTVVTQQRLLDIAMFAPQWIPFISDCLKWKGLESAVWWFHAHTKDAGYNQRNQLESDISRYSPIKAEALIDGAVDVNWFYEAYKTIGKKRWEQLYLSAKYISSGSGHKRAQTFADAMIGKLKLKPTLTIINEKRRQDYVRALGLIPLNKRTPEKDLLKRYQLIQKFKKESKQFGSQRQTSEGLAVKISLENLARTAGYSDPIRLTWAMETKEAKAIIEDATVIQKGDVFIELSIDVFGKATVKARKEAKELKAIPAKYRKDKAVLQLKSFAKTLQNQYRRTRKALEAAMCRRDVFELKEIQLLATHPVVAPMLNNLVLAVKDQATIGYFEQDSLVLPDGTRQVLTTDDELVIAHCTNLNASGKWAAFQKDCFAQKRVQPFKQVFRELYLPTPDELAQRTISRRYAGHQVNPKQTVALLKTRDWTVDRDMGLQKVYHDANCIVRLYALADWFTPADIEAPTLETLHFEYRDSYKKIPFEDIPPTIFSEVMRDVDLVVSVAHVGGVDPEASHSTIEMRKVLVSETATLLNLDNIQTKERHLLIKGELGDYSLHLGSGVVHRQPGGYVSIIPVHSQHRGRLFLPFMDDDPKSAEILSKVLFLAEDQKIKDPTIIRQLVQ